MLGGPDRPCKGHKDKKIQSALSFPVPRQKGRCQRENWLPVLVCAGEAGLFLCRSWAQETSPKQSRRLESSLGKKRKCVLRSPEKKFPKVSSSVPDPRWGVCGRLQEDSWLTRHVGLLHSWLCSQLSCRPSCPHSCCTGWFASVREEWSSPSGSPGAVAENGWSTGHRACPPSLPDLE